MLSVIAFGCSPGPGVLDGDWSDETTDSPPVRVNPRLTGVRIDNYRNSATYASFDAKEWRWADADDDCQDTRTEVLVRSGTNVTFTGPDECHVASGTWNDIYSGKSVTTYTDIEVDHLVPLRDAHASGGYRWTLEEKRAYANDLSNDFHLLVMAAGEHNRRTLKSPAIEEPPNFRFQCEYLICWASIKRKYKLSMTQDEFDSVNARLNLCVPYAWSQVGERETTCE